MTVTRTRQKQRGHINLYFIQVGIKWAAKKDYEVDIMQTINREINRIVHFTVRKKKPHTQRWHKLISCVKKTEKDLKTNDFQFTVH